MSEDTYTVTTGHTDVTNHVAEHIDPDRWASLAQAEGTVLYLSEDGKLLERKGSPGRAIAYLNDFGAPVDPTSPTAPTRTQYRTAIYTGLVVKGGPPMGEHFAKLGSFIDRLIRDGLIKHARLGPIVAIRLAGGPSSVAPKWFSAANAMPGDDDRMWHRTDPTVAFVDTATPTLCGRISHARAIDSKETYELTPEHVQQHFACPKCRTHDLAGTSEHGPQVERHALLFYTFSDFTREQLNEKLGGNYFTEEGALPLDHLPGDPT